MTPIIVAFAPIADTMGAEALSHMSQKILEGLITRDIKVISYACDGTEVERAVQRLLTEN